MKEATAHFRKFELSVSYLDKSPHELSFFQMSGFRKLFLNNHILDENRWSQFALIAILR